VLLRYRAKMLETSVDIVRLYVFSFVTIKSAVFRAIKPSHVGRIK
jgi:hypothetical protein